MSPHLTPHSLLGVLKWRKVQLLGAPLSSYLGDHSLDPLDQSSAKPAEGQGDGELLLREVLRKEAVKCG